MTENQAIAKLLDIDLAVDVWHAGNSQLPLHEFLGLTEEEFTLWMLDEYKFKQYLMQ